jgi:hypothetical protein
VMAWYWHKPIGRRVIAMEAFLKEQLKRIQDLAAQMTSLEKRAAEVASERIRQQELLSHGPLAEVRDLRTYRAYNSGHAAPGRQPRATANDRNDFRPRRRRRRRS